jgi:predicted TIM-barrel fold metal-dependent hydrolase
MLIGRPFTDTHVHFHDFSHPGLRWDWLTADAVDPELGNYDAIKARRYIAEDFLAETRFRNVGHVVHVQAAIGSADPVAETQWLQESADRCGVPHGIVAYTDLAAADCAETLAGHARFSNLRGIRDLRYDGYLADEAWQQGFARLADYGLVFCDDPLVEHMAALAALAKRYPDITICIDHAGYPRERGTAYFRLWRAEMKRLADCENTVVKISGLGMGDHRWSPGSIRPWVLACIELWGTDRAFFGTNWPVDRLYSSYCDVIDAYGQVIEDFADAEIAALWSGTADRVFGLGGAADGAPC